VQEGFLHDFETSTKELFWRPETNAGAAVRKRNVTFVTLRLSIPQQFWINQIHFL
jgi:hypothetical protein